jgi:hypothetical protein
MTAEWQKLTGNKLLAGFTVWVYPIGAFTFLLMMGILIGLTDGPTPFVGGTWTIATLNTWNIVLNFPSNVIARLPLIAFAAIAFAGEYEWNTWKNIVPRTPRALLIVAKLVTLALLITASLALTSLIWGAGRGIIALVYGQDFGPALDAEVLGDFARSYAVEISLSFVMLILLSAIVAITVMLTRSVVGGILLGFGLSIVEGLAGLLFGLIARLFDHPEWINGYAYTPAFAVENIRAWIIEGQAVIPAPTFTAEHSLAASMLVLAVWLIGVGGLTIWMFERQDLTS